MEFTDLILYLLIFVVAFALGWIQRERVAMTRVENFLSQFDNDIPVGEEVPDDRDDYIRLNVEQHGHILYFYNEETDEFVGQGSTKEDVKNILRSKYPNRKFAINEEGVALLEALK